MKISFILLALLISFSSTAQELTKDGGPTELPAVVAITKLMDQKHNNTCRFLPIPMPPGRIIITTDPRPPIEIQESSYVLHYACHTEVAIISIAWTNYAFTENGITKYKNYSVIHNVIFEPL